MNRRRARRRLRAHRDVDAQGRAVRAEPGDDAVGGGDGEVAVDHRHLGVRDDPGVRSEYVGDLLSGLHRDPPPGGLCQVVQQPEFADGQVRPRTVQAGHHHRDVLADGAQVRAEPVEVEPRVIELQLGRAQVQFGLGTAQGRNPGQVGDLGELLAGRVEVQGGVLRPDPGLEAVGAGLADGAAGDDLAQGERGEPGLCGDRLGGEVGLHRPQPQQLPCAAHVARPVRDQPGELVELEAEARRRVRSGELPHQRAGAQLVGVHDADRHLVLQPDMDVHRVGLADAQDHPVLGGAHKVDLTVEELAQLDSGQTAELAVDAEGSQIRQLVHGLQQAGPGAVQTRDGVQVPQPADRALRLLQQRGPDGGAGPGQLVEVVQGVEGAAEVRGQQSTGAQVRHIDAAAPQQGAEAGAEGVQVTEGDRLREVAEGAGQPARGHPGDAGQGARARRTPQCGRRGHELRQFVERAVPPRRPGHGQLAGFPVRALGVGGAQPSAGPPGQVADGARAPAEGTADRGPDAQAAFEDAPAEGPPEAVLGEFGVAERQERRQHAVEGPTQVGDRVDGQPSAHAAADERGGHEEVAAQREPPPPPRAPGESARHPQRRPDRPGRAGDEAGQPGHAVDEHVPGGPGKIQQPLAGHGGQCPGRHQQPAALEYEPAARGEGPAGDTGAGSEHAHQSAERGEALGRREEYAEEGKGEAEPADLALKVVRQRLGEEDGAQAERQQSQRAADDHRRDRDHDRDDLQRLPEPLEELLLGTLLRRRDGRGHHVGRRPEGVLKDLGLAGDEVEFGLDVVQRGGVFRGGRLAGRGHLDRVASFHGAPGPALGLPQGVRVSGRGRGREVEGAVGVRHERLERLLHVGAQGVRRLPLEAAVRRGAQHGVEAGVDIARQIPQQAEIPCEAVEDTRIPDNRISRVPDHLFTHVAKAGHKILQDVLDARVSPLHADDFLVTHSRGSSVQRSDRSHIPAGQ